MHGHETSEKNIHATGEKRLAVMTTRGKDLQAGEYGENFHFASYVKCVLFSGLHCACNSVAVSVVI